MLAMALVASGHPAAHAEPGDRSPAVGAELSAAGAVVAWTGLGVGAATGSRPGMAAGVVGVVLAPSLGPVYGGRLVTGGLVVRSVAASAAVAALALCSRSWAEAGRSCNAGLQVTADVAVAVVLGATIYDIAKAPRLVRSYNRRRRAIAVAPLVRTDGGGLVLTGQF
ncbi:MAG: hypothetical protein R3B06_00175 [Kofleriaceae bacterium]